MVSHHGDIVVYTKLLYSSLEDLITERVSLQKKSNRRRRGLLYTHYMNFKHFVFPNFGSELVFAIIRLIPRDQLQN